jgi:hypothetical protein
MLSFQQIELQDPLASELLSFMSLRDREDIPEELMLHYGEHEREGEPVSEIELVDGLGILKAFSIVIEGKRGSFDLHRLAHLVADYGLLFEASLGCQPTPDGCYVTSGYNRVGTELN